MNPGCLIAALLCVSLIPVSGRAAESGVPDFSGVWARTTFAFDLPPAGTEPSPLRNLARRPNGTSDAFKLVGDYRNPILKPEAAEIVRQHGLISLAGKSYPDHSNECRPLPPPYVLRIAQMQIVQEKDRVTLMYVQDQQVRRVRLNSTHPKPLTPSWYGDSIGYYEGDTLVIDTVGIKTRQGAMIDLYGTPYSDALHVVERYRLIDGEQAAKDQDASEKEYGRPTTEPVYIDFAYKGKGLRVDFTVEDERTFTTPWSSGVTFRKSDGPWREIVCAENMFDFYAGQTATVPRAERPEF